MGATDSKHKLGERVLAARQKLQDDKKMQSERVKEIKLQSPKTIEVIMKSIKESLKSCAPFFEPTLLIAWESDSEQCKKDVLDCSRRVLTAPIVKQEYEWFIKYLFPSSIWMYKTKNNRFMYEDLIDIINDMQQNIVQSMDSIYSHLQFHQDWQKVLDIKNTTVVSRQDDKKVGLLQEEGICNVAEMKQIDEKTNINELQTFIDTNLAINILTTTAKNINQEFQNYINTVMNYYGDFRPGPIKKVERCLSKLENDYSDAAFPKSAKLLDLVRCSITFNTVDQLVIGYNGLMDHISKNSNTIELARIKNGFIDKQYSGGYRDIKVNVIYHSSINPDIKMICEIQLLLGQYLHEKKRIHKLYNIARQHEYFKMTVTQQQLNTKDKKDLKFNPILNVNKQVKQANIDNKYAGKCSVDSELGLLAVESGSKISCIDITKQKEIFYHHRQTSSMMMFSHQFVAINNDKYLSVQTSKNTIKFFKIEPNNNNFIEEKELMIHLEEKDTVTCCEFDKTFENIIIVKNNKTLEKRTVKKSNKVLTTIELEQKISSLSIKTLSLSNDGKWIIIGGGNVSYFYLIEIDKKVQHKVISKNLNWTYAPCFINGDTKLCMMGGDKGKFEVWDVQKRVLIKFIKMDNVSPWVTCSTSRNNILAIGSNDQKLCLWNTQKWEMFWSQKYEMYPKSVHLTDDEKYLTIGGKNGEICLVLGIE